jgi:hypothetical protein
LSPETRAAAQSRAYRQGANQSPKPVAPAGTQGRLSCPLDPGRQPCYVAAMSAGFQALREGGVNFYRPGLRLMPRVGDAILAGIARTRAGLRGSTCQAIDFHRAGHKNSPPSCVGEGRGHPAISSPSCRAPGSNALTDTMRAVATRLIRMSISNIQKRRDACSYFRVRPKLV